MRDIEFVVELAKAYGRALITRDELQDEIHACSLDTLMFGVNAFAEDFGHEAAAAFVVAAELPIIYELVKLPVACLASPDTNWLPDGYWCVGLLGDGDPADCGIRVGV